MSNEPRINAEGAEGAEGAEDAERVEESNHEGTKARRNTKQGIRQGFLRT